MHYVSQIEKTPETDARSEIMFPCFKDETLFLYVREHDPKDDDTSGDSIGAINCNDLYDNTSIQVPVKEKSTFLETVYDIV